MISGNLFIFFSLQQRIRTKNEYCFREFFTVERVTVGMVNHPQKLSLLWGFKDEQKMRGLIGPSSVKIAHVASYGRSGGVHSPQSISLAIQLAIYPGFITGSGNLPTQPEHQKSRTTKQYINILQTGFLRDGPSFYIRPYKLSQQNVFLIVKSPI